MDAGNRDGLHKLVDALPDEALASVERTLLKLQTWPAVPRQTDELSKRLDVIIAEREAASTAFDSGNSRSTLGRISGWVGGAGSDAEEHSRAHASGMIRGAKFDIELHLIFGQGVQIDRDIHISPDKRKLLYTIVIKGPDGMEARREMEFEMTDDPPANANTQ